MTQFTVPRFKEQKAKIVGPLTFEQFVYIGTAGAISFVLYYTISNTSFALFFMSSAIVMAIGAGLAFGSINGRPIPLMLKNLVSFFLGPKIYLWKRKPRASPQPTEEKPILEKTEKPKAPVFGVARNGKLKNLSVEIETRSK